MLSFIKDGYGFAVLPEGTSVDSEITYVPLSGSSPISHGIFYKKSPKNPLINQFISTVLQK